MHSEYACEECDGYGEIICHACDQETSCDECNGTGLNGDLIDAEAWGKASDALTKEIGHSSAWIENGVWLGRTNGKTNLAYKDFTKVAT